MGFKSLRQKCWVRGAAYEARREVLNEVRGWVSAMAWVFVGRQGALLWKPHSLTVTAGAPCDVALIFWCTVGSRTQGWPHEAPVTCGDTVRSS